ncbi:Polymer-forming protein [Duganella sp. CF458]|uniref:polymer-forming cytoskeletal protein n=1 Tax=Duganella sp. CF458 TaxID=1884368 RepID=UPI0008E58B2E|nr:polymer-forming cytoskeletal protein [Duganella sp. CF458]SFF51999.1 Polymer-forming protein [Duganella sp. CF458]
MSWIVLFFAFQVVLFMLPLLPALVEWRVRRDAQPLKVVRDYDGNIKHFANRFRQFLGEQFAELAQAAGAATVPRNGRLATGDRYQLVGADGTPSITEQERAAQAMQQLVLGTGALELGQGLLYEKEVFAAGAIRTGNGNSFRALLARGDIVLGEQCDVLRWAHSDTRLTAGRRARLFGRVSANQELVLHGETRFGRMHAPTIRFGAALPAPLPQPQPASRKALERPAALLDDAAGRWLAGGDLDVPEACLHHGNLVARGSMTLGMHAMIEGSIKCHGDLHVAAGARIDGALVCSGNMFIGPGCTIRGPLVCEKSIEIDAGTVLGSDSAETTVTAVEIRVREGAVAHGTVWARELGYVVPAATIS